MVSRRYEYSDENKEIVSNIIDEAIDFNIRNIDLEDNKLVSYFVFNKKSSFLFSLSFDIEVSEDEASIKVLGLHHGGNFPFHLMIDLPKDKKHYALSTIIIKEKIERILNNEYKPLNIMEYQLKKGDLSYKDIDDIVDLIFEDIDLKERVNHKSKIYQIIEDSKDDYIPAFNHIYYIAGSWFIKRKAGIMEDPLYLEFYEDVGIL